MSEFGTDLNILVLSHIGDSEPVAALLAAFGANVVMFKVVDTARGAHDDRLIYHAESWRLYLKHDFPDLVIYDDVGLYHKWVSAIRDRKGVPVLYLDSGVERRAIVRAVRDVPVTALASILHQASESPNLFKRIWRRIRRA